MKFLNIAIYFLTYALIYVIFRKKNFKLFTEKLTHSPTSVVGTVILVTSRLKIPRFTHLLSNLFSYYFMSYFVKININTTAIDCHWFDTLQASRSSRVPPCCAVSLAGVSRHRQSRFSSAFKRCRLPRGMGRLSADIGGES